MSLYISAEKLIEAAKEKGINFGKGDPYNRLRYYTKIGWLPHMERMKNSEGEVVGHYPEWALSRLELIESLKSQGKSNSLIEKSIKDNQIKQNLQQTFSFLNTSEKRSQLVIYMTFILLLGIVLSETGVFPGLNSKQNLLNQIQNQNIPPRLLESGETIFPPLQKSLFIPTSAVTENSRINVTFEDNYSPASRYWISRKVTGQGFYIDLDLPIAQNAKLNWFVLE
uniref:HTH merR-type domain-containing protein n=1 Tax=candidate division WWE3 bacterium TaxID=2053526 RepID=A0A7C4XU27_UNCKA